MGTRNDGKPRYDIIISYRHANADRVWPLADAPRVKGLQVWIDDREVSDFQSISRSIAHGLTNAKALLAFYSGLYPQSRACQWELTAGFLAAQQEGEARRRGLVNE